LGVRKENYQDGGFFFVGLFGGGVGGGGGCPFTGNFDS